MHVVVQHMEIHVHSTLATCIHVKGRHVDMYIVPLLLQPLQTAQSIASAQHH